MSIPCIKDELRLNKFEQHRCLTSKDIYKKMGARSQSAQSSEEVAHFSRNPLEMADADYDSYCKAAAEDARKRAEEARKQREQQEKDKGTDE